MGAIKESLGSESNQRSLSIKLLLSVSRERAIKDPSASRFDRAIKRVSSASNWPSAQDVSPYKSVSGMAAIRILSVVRAIMRLSVVRAIEESLGCESKHEVLAGSFGQASKEAQRTDTGNSITTDEQRTLRAVPSPGLQLRRCVPYHLRVYNYDRRIGDQGGGCTWCNRCSSAGKKGC